MTVRKGNHPLLWPNISGSWIIVIYSDPWMCIKPLDLWFRIQSSFYGDISAIKGDLLVGCVAAWRRGISGMTKTQSAEPDPRTKTRIIINSYHVVNQYYTGKSRVLLRKLIICMTIFSSSVKLPESISWRCSFKQTAAWLHCGINYVGEFYSPTRYHHKWL